MKKYTIEELNKLSDKDQFKLIQENLFVFIFINKISEYVLAETKSLLKKTYNDEVVEKRMIECLCSHDTEFIMFKKLLYEETFPIKPTPNSIKFIKE